MRSAQIATGANQWGQVLHSKLAARRSGAGCASGAISPTKRCANIDSNRACVRRFWNRNHRVFIRARNLARARPLRLRARLRARARGNLWLRPKAAVCRVLPGFRQQNRLPGPQHRSNRGVQKGSRQESGKGRRRTMIWGGATVSRGSRGTGRGVRSVHRDVHCLGQLFVELLFYRFRGARWGEL